MFNIVHSQRPFLIAYRKKAMVGKYPQTWMIQDGRTEETCVIFLYAVLIPQIVLISTMLFMLYNFRMATMPSVYTLPIFPILSNLILPWMERLPCEVLQFT